MKIKMCQINEIKTRSDDSTEGGGGGGGRWGLGLKIEGSVLLATEN